MGCHKLRRASARDYTVDLTEDKSTVEISQNFVAFSEYMNFKKGSFV